MHRWQPSALSCHDGRVRGGGWVMGMVYGVRCMAWHGMVWADVGVPGLHERMAAQGGNSRDG